MYSNKTHGNKARLSTILGTLLTLALGLVSAQDLTYTFEDGQLEGPQTLEVNGFQKVTFANHGDAELDMPVVRLREGATLAAYIAVDRAINDAFASSGGDARRPLGEWLSLADAVGGVYLAAQT